MPALLTIALLYSTPTKKLEPMSKNPQVLRKPIQLNELVVGMQCTIEVMVCRKWDVCISGGKYLGTYFIFSDNTGNVIHCTTKSNIAHCFIAKLEAGSIYYLKDFIVMPNKDRFRIIKNNKHMIELEGSTIVTKSQSGLHGFVRYPFEFTEFEDIKLSANNDLTDIMGYVTNVGSIKNVSPTKKQRNPTYSQTLDVHLINERGSRIRVTLWDNVGNEFLEKKATHEANYAIILVGMNAKEFSNELYFSSTSATQIIDFDEIPQLLEFQKRMRGIDILPEIAIPVEPAMIEGSIHDLLEWSKAKKENSIFQLHVTISNVRTQYGWYYSACSSGKCMKCVRRRNGNFWCHSCEKPVDFPKIGFKLQLDIEDATGTTAVTLFDDTAEKLVNAKAETLLNQLEVANDESVLPNALVNLIRSSHTLQIKSQTLFTVAGFDCFTCYNIIPSLPSSNKALTKSPQKRQRDETASESSQAALGIVENKMRSYEGETMYNVRTGENKIQVIAKEEEIAKKKEGSPENEEENAGNKEEIVEEKEKYQP